MAKVADSTEHPQGPPVPVLDPEPHREEFEIRKPINIVVHHDLRSCTDVFCCLIFGAFVAGWVVLAIFGKLPLVFLVWPTW